MTRAKIKSLVWLLLPLYLFVSYDVFAAGEDCKILTSIFESDGCGWGEDCKGWGICVRSGGNKLEEKCDKDEHCESGFCYYHKDRGSLCTPKGSKKNGESCVHDDECESTKCPLSGICIPKEGLASGERCIYSSDCQTDNCVNGQCTDGKHGDLCSSEYDCQSGNCGPDNTCIEEKETSKETVGEGEKEKEGEPCTGTEEEKAICEQEKKEAVAAEYAVDKVEFKEDEAKKKVAKVRASKEKVLDFKVLESKEKKEADHKITVLSVEEEKATLKIESEPQEITLSVGGDQEIDVDGDQENDLKVTLDSVDVGGGTADFTMEALVMDEEVTESATPSAVKAPLNVQVAEPESPQNTNQIPLPSGGYDPIMTNNEVLNIVKKSPNTENSLRELLSNKNGILKIANSVMGTIAILWLMILGVKFSLSQGEDDKLSKYKQQFGWIALGLAVISVAEFVAFSVFDPTAGDVLTGGSANTFADKASQIKVYFQTIVGAIAVVACIMSGYNLITGGSEDEAITNEKKFLHSFFFGVGFILMAEALVGIMSLQGGAEGSSGRIVSEIVGIINFMLTFVAVAAVFMLVLASLYYVTNFGNEEQANKAKSIIKNTIIAIIVCLSCYVFIRFFIR